MKANIWFAVGCVLMVVSLFSFFAGALLSGSTMTAFNVTAILSYIAALACYHMGHIKQ